MKNITIKDVAKHAKVGISTVSRVINNHPYVKDSVRAHVIQVIKQLNYTPNNSARHLKYTESSNIGVLVKGVSNSFFSKIIELLQHHISQAYYDMILHYISFEDDEIEQARLLSKEKRLAGLIFLGGSFVHLPQELSLLSVPFVCLTNTLLHCPPLSFSSICVDDVMESYRATEYLLSLGHRHIAILTADYQNHSVAKLRFKGFSKALANHPFPVVSSVHLQATQYTLHDGYKIMKHYLHNHSITALYATSDILAVGACKAILDYGLSIPDDISVIGFDGQEIAEYFHPSISTIEQPIQHMAQQATEQLFLLIKGYPHRQIILPAKLIERKSCAQVYHTDPVNAM